jgi:hypothetical protein
VFTQSFGQRFKFFADPVGIGVPQVVEDALGLCPGVVCGFVVAGGVVRVAEAVEGAGALVALPGLEEQFDGVLVALDGLLVVAEVVVGVTEAVPDITLELILVEAAYQFQCLSAVHHRLLASILQP